MTNEKQSPHHFPFTAQSAPSFQPATAADCWQYYRRSFCGLLITIIASVVIIAFWRLIKAQHYVGITTFHHTCYLIFGSSCKCNRNNENAFLEIAFIVTCRTQRGPCKSQMKITSHSPNRNDSICKSSLLSVPCLGRVSPAPLLTTLAIEFNQRKRGQVWESICTWVSMKKAKRRAEHGILYPVKQHSRRLCQTVPLHTWWLPQHIPHKARWHRSQFPLQSRVPAAIWSCSCKP